MKGREEWERKEGEEERREAKGKDISFKMSVHGGMGPADRQVSARVFAVAKDGPSCLSKSLSKEIGSVSDCFCVNLSF